MKSLLHLLALTATLTARPLTIAWDPQDHATGYIVQQLDPETDTWLDAGESTTNEFTSEFPDAELKLRCIAFADAMHDGRPAGRITGPPSEPLLVPAMPAITVGLTVTVNISLTTAVPAAVPAADR